MLVCAALVGANNAAARCARARARGDCAAAHMARADAWRGEETKSAGMLCAQCRSSGWRREGRGAPGQESVMLLPGDDRAEGRGSDGIQADLRLRAPSHV